MDSRDIIFFIVIVLLLVGFSYFAYHSDMFLLPEGFSFCQSKGFDGNSWDGSYSKKFGKVKCASCYNRECIYEEFEVIKKFGIITEKEKF